MTTPAFVVVPTKGRPDLLHRCLVAVGRQVDGVVLVDNNDEPDWAAYEMAISLGQVMRLRTQHVPGYPPNLSRLLNIGLDAAAEEAEEFGAGAWDAVLLNDDVEVPDGWVAAVSTAMRATSAVLGYTDRVARAEPTLFTGWPASGKDLATVWACVLRGESGLRFDEGMAWWYSDTDLDLRCRHEHGGVLAVPGPPPLHHHPSAQTMADPVLLQQTERDRTVFLGKWGRLP